MKAFRIRLTAKMRVCSPLEDDVQLIKKQRSYRVFNFFIYPATGLLFSSAVRRPLLLCGPLVLALGELWLHRYALTSSLRSCALIVRGLQLAAVIIYVDVAFFRR
jgi:hypothetical protein